MPPLVETFDFILNVSSSWSVHGLRHAIYRSHRLRSSRLAWFALVFFFCSLCCYLQLTLLYETILKKPILVKSDVYQTNSINFPNLVVCDLNQEEDKLLDYLDSGFGNSGMLHRFMAQMSKLELFEHVRSMLRDNITRTLNKYPLIAEQYKEYYRLSDPIYMDFSGENLQ